MRPRWGGWAWRHRTGSAGVCCAGSWRLGSPRRADQETLAQVAVEALQEFVDNFTYFGIFAVLLLGSLGVPIPEEMPIIAAAVLSHEGVVRWWLAARLHAGGAVRRHGALLGRPALGRAGPQLATGPTGPVARAGAVAESGVSAACAEDRRHGAARHGTSRRRVSDSGQCARPVLEVRGGGRGRRLVRRPVGVRVGLLLHGSDQSHHGRRAQGRALARARRPPGAGGDAGCRTVAMESSRRDGASGRGTFAAAVSSWGSPAEGALPRHRRALSEPAHRAVPRCVGGDTCLPEGGRPGQGGRWTAGRGNSLWLWLRRSLLGDQLSHQSAFDQLDEGEIGDC